MATSGPNSGGTFANETESGALVNWSNASNAQTNDGSGATCGSSSGSPFFTDRLKATNFGFAIPGGATINGITVEIDRYYYAGGGLNIRDYSIKLVKGGTVQGDEKSTGALWPSSASPSYATYGGSSDLWGLTFTDSDINSSGFGVIICGQSDATSKAFAGFGVDHIRITVDYTTGGGGGGSTSGSALLFFL